MNTLQTSTGLLHPIDSDAEQRAAARVVGVIALLLAMGIALAGVRMVRMNTDPLNDQPALNVHLPATVHEQPASPRL